MLIEARVTRVDQALEERLDLLPPIRKVIADDIRLEMPPRHVQVLGVAPQRGQVVLRNVPRHVEQPRVGAPYRHNHDLDVELVQPLQELVQLGRGVGIHALAAVGHDGPPRALEKRDDFLDGRRLARKVEMGDCLFGHVGVARHGQLQHLRGEVGRSVAGDEYQGVVERLPLRRVDLVDDPVDHLEDEPVARVLLVEAELYIQGVVVSLKAVIAIARERRVLQDAEGLSVQETEAYQMQLLVGDDGREPRLQALDQGLDDAVGPGVEVEIGDLAGPELAVPDDGLQQAAQLAEVVPVEGQRLEQLGVGHELGEALLGDGRVHPVQDLLEDLVVHHLAEELLLRETQGHGSRSKLCARADKGG
ncbi:hypothetical protein PG993_007906 [Apiospora rasikravindrae]|uniref:Uncharacterized protein n=1 Tax=Apiospora rasikravindrae TaxID=990691 RepID=A0ABR1SYT9_9PEZI